MWIYAVISGIGLWLTVATLVIAIAVSAGRGDLTMAYEEPEDDLETVILARTAA